MEGEHSDNMPFGDRAMGFAVAHAFFPSRQGGGNHHELEVDKILGGFILPKNYCYPVVALMTGRYPS